jgi:hypothetical protein
MRPELRAWRPSRRTVAAAAGVASALLVLVVGLALTGGGNDAGTTGAAPPGPVAVRTPKPANRAFDGITTFRGNATRSYYGTGPVPLDPVVRWQHPERTKLCSTSIVGVDLGEWCGTGWTGQPNVVELSGGGVEVREGAYDGRYHFVDGDTGEPVRPPLGTQDLAKGSATPAPHGFPLSYAGSRDGHLRIVALDRESPQTLWSIDGGTSVPEPLRNDDWDGAPLVIKGHLLVGGENGWFYVIRAPGRTRSSSSHRWTRSPRTVSPSRSAATSTCRPRRASPAATVPRGWASSAPSSWWSGGTRCPAARSSIRPTVT